MNEKLLENILSTDSKIRYVGLLDKDMKTVTSKTRKGLKLLLGKNADNELVNFTAPIVFGALSRFTDKLGKLVWCAVRYDKVNLIFFKIKGDYLVISLDRGTSANIISKIEDELQSIIK